MHTFWAPGHRRDGLAPLLTAQKGCQVSLCLCRAAPAGPVQRQGGFDFRRRGAEEPEKQKKERRGRKGDAEERASKHQQSSEGKEGEGKGGGRSRAQPEPSEQRNREGREGDGRCRLAVAKGGGRVPRDGALTAPAGGKPLLSILPNTAGRKRHPQGTDKEHGHKAAIKAEARPRLEPPKTKKPYQRPLALRINSALPG